ncbi:unnamed protein product [Taenia asiatica]|uniref:Ras-GAP domain-containing protein n=1 Tax=Taenia asiatica TaxID=60517 RepID=A0A0R3VWC5_TAEAS|nr:unnamed protein product [Taenia asiatica]
MGSSLFTCLRDSILRQNVHDCFHALQHPKLHLSDLLEPCHKEWYFVVLENNLGTITQCLDGACGDDETLARSLRVSVKLANAYARRELLLDHSLQRINTAIQRDDPIVTMSALIEHNDNMNGIARDLVGTLSVEEISNSLKLRARVDLIHEELKAALGEKGEDLTYEEMLTVLRVLLRVIALNEAVSVRNESKIMSILLAKDALWENVVESNGDWGAAYFCRLCKARKEKSTETGRPSILSHCEIQRIINEVAEAKHFPCEASAALTMTKFEASTSADEEVTDASRACSVCAVKTCKYYISRLNRSLAPGNEFVLWGWLQALRTTGCLSSVSAQLSSEHIDLYRRVLSTLRVDNACSVRKSLESAHKIHAKALALGKTLAELNAFLQEPNDWEGLKRYLLGLEGKGLTPRNTILRLNVERKHIEEYVEALFQVKISKTMDTLSKNTKALHDRKDYHMAENYGWLVTSLASIKDKGKEEDDDDNDIYFYFNIKSLKLIWKPSYTTPEPTYLEPDLLNREEIEKCISQVNLGVPLQQTKVKSCISLEAFDLLDRLIRAWVVKQHYHEWNLTMSEGIKTVCEKMSLFQGICRCQALWRGFCMRRRYKAYLQALRSPELRIAATRILHFIRSHRRRRFVKQSLIGLRRVLRCIRRFQALWRGFTLRRTLTASLALALNPMLQSACERPLISLVRLCSSCLVPAQADNIYNFQLDCLQAAQSTADNAQQLVSLQDEIELSSKLLQLAEQMRREAVASKLRRPTLCFSSIALCGGSRVLLNNLKQSQISAGEQVSQKYSGLLFLLYSEPDYLARLLIELPAHVLWVEKQEGVLETCKPSEFALRLERIILSFYNYGKRGGDEVSLTFLITRALHMQLHATSWNDIKGTRGHFALRLAVAMTHVSHSMQGTAVRHLIPLLQDILIADAKRQEKESGPVARMPEGDVSPSLLNNSRSDGSARKLESTNAVDGDAAMEVTVALSREESEERRMDATSVAAVARALSRTPSKVANVSWLVHVAERLFFALFEEGGGVTLPSPMLRLIREVFCLMRQLYPHQPIKELLKFLGLHLFYRYIHSIILAPDAFTAIVTDSKKPTPTVERPQEIQRATLAGLSRLLCLVVENKGIASNTEVADQTQALNSLIKMWHVRFKTYLLSLIGNEGRCWNPSAEKLRRQAEAWVGRLPCSKEVSTEASNVTMNVEEIVELHRLVNAYRAKIAPNPEDPLHQELQKVGQLPQILYRHPGAKGEERTTCEESVWNVKVTKQRPPKESSGLGSFKLIDHITSKNAGAALRLCEVPPRVRVRDGGGGNTNNNSMALGKPQLAGKKDSRIRETLFRYYRFDSNNAADLVLPEGTQLQLSIKAKGAKELADACLYAARALGLASTACFTFASRTCCSLHTRNPKVACAHNPALFTEHTFQPEAKNCVFCASERTHRRPLELVFGWTEALPPTEKSMRLLGRRVSNGDANGVRSEKFTIGETHRRARFTIGQDGVIVSATPTNSEKIVWPVDAREIGTSWTRAKRALVHTFSCLAAHRDLLSDELLIEKQKSVSNVPSWFSLLRSWSARATARADAQLCRCLHSCPSGGGCVSLKRLQEGVSTLHTSISNIQTMTGENTTTLWHDLIAGVARDVFHMDAACVDTEWRNIGDRLAAVNCTLKHRIHKSLLTLNSIRQSLSHSLRLRSPLISKFAIR